MKAHIKGNGTLVLLAETETEEYALTQWMMESTKNAIMWTLVSGENSTKLTEQLDTRRAAQRIDGGELSGLSAG